MPEITEADRAAAVMVMMGNRDAKDAVLAGQDDNWIVQAFAAHREATEAAIVAWFHAEAELEEAADASLAISRLADRAAAGAHRS